MTIDFSCICGQGFSFPTDAAGTWIQCPKCRRLNQVAAPPTLLSPDAAYTLAEPAPPAPVSVADLIDTFSRQRLNLRGQEKDLRLTADDIPASDAFVEDAPPIDATTGEAIPTLAVAERHPAPSLPLPPIAGSRPRERLMSPALVALALFDYRNIIVLLFIFLFQLAAHFIGKFIFLAFAAPLLVALGGVLLAHFGCIVEETGPESRDELPGPLRSLGWNDDIWQPFQRTVAALLICYFPAWIVLRWEPTDPVIQMIATGIAIVGSVFFPAVLLTLITSGTALNLRPDRVIGVITTSRSYFRIMLCWTAALLGYVGGTIAFADAINDAFSFHYRIPGSLAMLGLATLWLWAGVYAVHYFCWSLGLLYRESHAQFPWVYQFHMPVHRGKGGEETDTRRAAFYDRLDARLAQRRTFGGGPV